MLGVSDRPEATTENDELDSAAAADTLEAAEATEAIEAAAAEALDAPIAEELRAMVDEPEADELDTGAGCPAPAGGEYGVSSELPGTFGL